jgi:hypothetical protein
MRSSIAALPAASFGAAPVLEAAPLVDAAPLVPAPSPDRVMAMSRPWSVVARVVPVPVLGVFWFVVVCSSVVLALGAPAA